MFKTIADAVLISGYLIGTLPSLAKSKKLQKQGKIEEKQKLMAVKAKNLVDALSKIVGITYDIDGLDNIPDGPVLYTANHQGLFDAMVMLVKMREPCGFLIKKEAKSIPILSKWMNEMECIFVDRENPREAVKSIHKGVEIIKSGRSLVVFPEGTRSKTDEIGEFKNGAFKIAQKTGCPIVPVAIDGTYHIFEEHKRIRSSAVKVRILPPVIVKDMPRSEFKTIAPKIREMIVNAKDNI